MKIEEEISKLRLPHSIYKHDDSEINTLLSILMPGYRVKWCYDIREVDYYPETIDSLDTIIEQLMDIITTETITEIQKGEYSSYEVDGIESGDDEGDGREYYIKIIAYKTK